MNVEIIDLIAEFKLTIHPIVKRGKFVIGGNVETAPTIKRFDHMHRTKVAIVAHFML
jgi:hypothetical protein